MLLLTGDALALAGFQVGQPLRGFRHRVRRLLRRRPQLLLVDLLPARQWQRRGQQQRQRRGWAQLLRRRQPSRLRQPIGAGREMLPQELRPERRRGAALDWPCRARRGQAGQAHAVLRFAEAAAAPCPPIPWARMVAPQDPPEHAIFFLSNISEHADGGRRGTMSI